MKEKLICISLFILLGFTPLWSIESELDTMDAELDELISYRHPRPVPLVVSTPRRSLLADAPCPVDSIIVTDRSGALLIQTYYQYDEAGHMVSEIQYAWSEGVRKGVSNCQKIFTGSIATTTVKYQWDPLSADWIGKDSTQLLYYDNGLQSAQEKYVWENDAWRIDSKYEYEYAADKKQTLSQYSEWNNEEHTLDFVNRWVWVYDNRLTEEAYWTYSGTAWVGYSRTVKDYDEAGNQILEEKYSGWENDAWKGKSKYTAQYNAAKKEIEHITYKWSASAWVESLKTTKEYDGENLLDDAVYYWSNGWVGNSRTSMTYSGSLLTSEIDWTWDKENAQWLPNTQTETQYTGKKISSQTITVWDGATWGNVSQLVNTYESDRLVETRTFAWNSSAWVDSLLTSNTYDAKGINTLSVGAAWNGSEWISTDSTTRAITYIIVAGKEVKQEDVVMSWTLATGLWIGDSRITYIYDEWGNVIQSDTYNYIVGTGWVNNVRRLYGYKDGNKKLQTLNAYMTWNQSKGVWKGTTKTEKVFDDTNRQIKISTYKWSADHNDWEGLSGTEDVYVDNVKVTSYDYKWDYDNWQWTGMFKHDYTYTASGEVADHITSRYNAETGWYYDTRLTNVYDAKGRTIRTENAQWILADSKWCATSLTQTSYDDDADGGRLRSQLITKSSACVETSYEYSSYFYACDPKYFTVRFVNYDAGLLDSKLLLEGTMPEYTGEAPAKPATAQYTYTFKGWTPELAAVTGEAIYTADYDSVQNTYLVTFRNYDGSELQSSQVAYGTMPEYTGEAPAKPATAQYTYTFKGWTPELTAVVGEAVYTADYDSVANFYTVTFCNYDGLELFSLWASYGTMPVYEGEIPTKPEDNQYTYSFKGWTPEIEPIKGDDTYTATFTSIPKIPTALSDVEDDYRVNKILRNGKIYIIRNGNTYAPDGALVR